MTKKETKSEKNWSAEPKIKEIIANITKEYGEGIITTLGQSRTKNNQVLSTGSLILDQAIGGGYAFGRMVELYGENASGKTTLALHAVKECQKAGKKAVYIDVENALNIKWAKSIGIEVDELITLQPECGEQAFRLVMDIIEEGISLIVIDSVATLISERELESNLGKPAIGSHALMMSNGLKQLNNKLTNRATILIFINQTRNKISTNYFAGNPETTTGGVSLGFYASLRIRLKEKEKIDKNGEYIGIRVQAKIKKNKLASPYKEPLLEIMFSQGIQKEREIIDLASELNILQKSGNWYAYGEKKLGNGKENVTDYLRENPEVYHEIKEAINNINSKMD